MNRIATHSGDVLKEELEARDITQKRLSEVLSIPYTQLNEILNGKRPVTSDFALIVEAALGINPEMLINMQTRYNMSVARRQRSITKQNASPFHVRHFIMSSDDCTSSLTPA